jgi:hypothetical protein
MSKIFLGKLLKESITIMKSDLRDELNLKKHTISFTSDMITKALVEQLKFTYVDGKAKYKAWNILSPKDKDMIEELIKNSSYALLDEIHTNYVNMAKKSNADPSDFIRVVVGKQTDDRSFVVNTYVKKGKKQYVPAGSSNNPYSTMREGYNDIVKHLWQVIGEIVVDKSGVKNEENKKELIQEFTSQVPVNLGHTEDVAVSTIQAGSGLDNLYNKLSSSVGSGAAEEIIQELGIDITLRYVSKSNQTIMEMEVESSSVNQSKGGKIEGPQLRSLISSLEKGMRIFFSDKQKIYDIAGSDNRVEIEKKKIVKSFNNKLKLSTKSIDTKLNLSSVTEKGKFKIKPEITASTKQKKPNLGKPVSKVLPSKKKSNRGSAQSSVALKELLNAAIDKQVAKNMKLPALRYRTGRFANSVQVTDITQTPQGYPSIGYTYMKYPYQTFEVGYAQGDPDRDPRKLIDKSIREAAAELLIGRFYTRRV